MAIDYTNMRVIDGARNQQTIETKWARYYAKRLMEVYTTKELDVLLPALLEIENLVKQGMSEEDAKKQVIKNYNNKTR